MSKNNVGHAFPSAQYPGMTIRDWFAGQALPGLLAGQYCNASEFNLSDLPVEAYRIADAMIAERGRG